QIDRRVVPRVDAGGGTRQAVGVLARDDAGLAADAESRVVEQTHRVGRRFGTFAGGRRRSARDARAAEQHALQGRASGNTHRYTSGFFCATSSPAPAESFFDAT